MITPKIEEMITAGQAEYRTYVVGASGTGNIPVPDNSFIIITDFDYWYFVDEPEPTPGEEAVAFLTITADVDPSAPFTLNYNINGIPLAGADVDFNPFSVGETQLNFQASLDLYFAGFTCTVEYNDNGLWIVTVLSTPGTTYNGQIIDGTIGGGGHTVIPDAFEGGTAAIPVTIADYLTRRSHQLQFKSQNASNHFIINEKIEVFDATVLGGAGFFVNVNGYYHKDTFLMHKTDVRINIIRVPQPEEWTTVYGALDNKSNEPPLPAGYGQAGIPNLDVVQQVLLNAVDEQYLPLGQKYSPQTLQEYTPEFKVAAVAGRELEDPTNVSEVKGVRRNYPLINIGYVVTNKNYSKHFTNG